jgi:hypothetical protein
MAMTSTKTAKSVRCRILVISSCTGIKSVHHEEQLTLDDFRDAGQLRRRENSLAQWKTKACELYAGNHHRYMLQGVKTLRRAYGRAAVDLRIISAGYGLLREDELIVPYDVTFEQMTADQAKAWGLQLGLPHAVRKAIRGYPLVVFLLGERYVRVVDPPIEPALQRLVFLVKPDLARALCRPGVTAVPLSVKESKRFRASTIALKGRVFALFARGLVAQGKTLWQAVLKDNTPSAFLRAVNVALAAEDEETSMRYEDLRSRDRLSRAL